MTKYQHPLFTISYRAMEEMNQELLSALKNLLVANGNQKDFPNIWKEAARAIARAEGKGKQP